ncbi:hypothetical protein VKT23_017363 [Stygiomarasmius scandens]|uniref:F-box domain-containing protein n=1 Tax=Marasmiellus scandens TaxID=2682957 RepID=A0ABR1IS57_9AGAR
MRNSLSDIPELPQELIDIIIDYAAQTSVPTLKSCSLVCHAWLPRARAHIFREISLPFIREQGVSYEQLIAKMRSSLQCLADMSAASPSPSLSRSFHFPSIADLAQSLVLPPKLPHFVPDTFFLLHPFTSLRHIAVTGEFGMLVAVTFVESESFSTFLERNSGSLETLKLRGITFNKVVDLVRLLTSLDLPKLRQLTLQWFQFLSDPTVQANDVRNFMDSELNPFSSSSPMQRKCKLKLDTLNIELDILQREAFFEFLTHQNSPLDLTCLKTLIIAPIFDMLESYTPLFEHVGTTLTRLIISMTDLSNPGQDPTPVQGHNLSYLQKLAHLELWILPNCQDLIDMLSTFTENCIPYSPSMTQLETLTVGFHDWKNRDEDRISDLSYGRLDEALAGFIKRQKQPLQNSNPETRLVEIIIEVSTSFGLEVDQVVELFPQIRAVEGALLRVCLFGEWYD